VRFRRDIEGLRAVAILGVLLAHAKVGLFEGGYCGVDVFYVISGFLITGILFRELEGSKTISLVGFYARRARRILPMAALVIVAVLLTSLVVFNPVERNLLTHDAVAASLYVVNWRFVQESVDYFGPSSATSPLQHYWSLSIEEQFYLVWPGLLLIATLWWRRVGRPSRHAAAVVLGAVAVLSLAYSISYTDSHPPEAYFSTFTRLWELALGGLLALAPLRPLSIPWSRVLAGAGLAAIVGAYVLLDAGSAFPGYLALIPTLGSAAVIAAGVGWRDSAPIRPMSSAPVQYIGRVSYSWYLWHWPFVVFAGAEWGPLSTAEATAAVAASFVPTVIGHHLVEGPVMRSELLRRRPWAALGVGALATFAGLAAAGLVWFAKPDIPTLPASKVEGAAALKRQQVPQESADALSPNPLEAGGDIGRLDADGCLLTFDETESGKCTYTWGNGDTKVVLLGDSHAAPLFAPLEQIGRERGWSLTGLAKDGCPPANALVVRPKLGGPYDDCQTWRESALRRIEAEKPDLVVVTGDQYYDALGPDGSGLASADSDRTLEAGYADTLKRLEATGAKVAAVRDIPEAPLDVPGCVAESLDSLDDCGFAADSRKPSGWDLRAIRSVPGVDLVDLTKYICPDGHCRAVIGDAVTYLDTNHLTATFARTLAPMIERELPVARNG
jgi:peptidoglycan/LPS O-acetylase OafA/YrhL